MRGLWGMEAVTRVATRQQADTLACAAAGDEIAFGHIIAAHHEDMRRVCMAISGINLAGQISALQRDIQGLQPSSSAFVRNRLEWLVGPSISGHEEPGERPPEAEPSEAATPEPTAAIGAVTTQRSRHRAGNPVEALFVPSTAGPTDEPDRTVPGNLDRLEPQVSAGDTLISWSVWSGTPSPERRADGAALSSQSERTGGSASRSSSEGRWSRDVHLTSLAPRVAQRVPAEFLADLGAEAPPASSGQSRSAHPPAWFPGRSA